MSCINALERAFTISTQCKSSCAWSIDVSMPSDGLIPFLLPTALQATRARRSCVNALWRAYTISTRTLRQRRKESLVCQCPLAGLYHFYLQTVEGSPPDNGFVSMPSGELISFLHYVNQKPESFSACVNALERANIISTLSSQKPLFMRVSSYYYMPFSPI